MPDDLHALARQIDAVARLHGQFRLRSGAVSGEYFDKYRFESDPKLLTAIADALADLVPPDIQALAGLELGGVPVATALSIRTGLAAVFVRKQAKSKEIWNVPAAGLTLRALLTKEDLDQTRGAG